MVKYILLALILMLSSCAPMPGGKFLKGIDHVTELEDIPELIIHDVSIFESTAVCNYLVFKENPLLVIVTMGGIPACADVTPDGKGGIKKCEVWAPGEGYLMEHELMHCRGWADKWY